MNDSEWNQTVSQSDMELNATRLPHDVEFDTVRTVFGVFELIYCIIGTPLNIFVIILCLQILIKGEINHNNQYFVLSMTLADLMATAIHSPLSFCNFALKLVFEGLLCHFYFVATYLAAIGSSLSLLFLNMDKFLFIHFPLHYFLVVKREFVYIALCFIWVVSSLATSLVLYGPGTKYVSDSCGFVPKNQWWYFSLFFVGYVFPLIVSFCTASYIAVVVIRAKKTRTGKKTTNGNGASGAQKKLDHLRSIVFVFTSTLWSSLTVLPYRIGFILYAAFRGWFTSTGLRFMYVLNMLLWLSPVLNPVITIVTQKQYSRQIRKLLYQLRGKQDPQVTDRKKSLFEMEMRERSKSMGAVSVETLSSKLSSHPVTSVTASCAKMNFCAEVRS